MRTRASLRYLPALLGGVLGLAAALPSQAVQQGDWLVRAGVGHVSPDDSSGEITGVAGSKVDVDSATNLAVNFTYMVSHNVGVELLGALPFKHDIKSAGTIAALDKIAETKQLPPTLVVLYNFAPTASVRPYAGVGLNYTTFFGEKVTSALKGPGLASDISLDSSTGLAAEVGVDVDVNKDWFFNASVWRMDLDTTATLKGGALDGAEVDVAIDPWAYFVGVGRKF